MFEFETVLWIRNNFFSDPDPTFQEILDPIPDPALFLSEEANKFFTKKLQ